MPTSIPISRKGWLNDALEHIEDFTYFSMLAKKSPEKARGLLNGVMRSATDDDRDFDKLEQVRRKVARELVKR